MTPSVALRRDSVSDAFLLEGSWGLKLLVQPYNPTPIVLLTGCCGAVYQGGGSDPTYRPKCGRCREVAPEWVSGQDGYSTRREFSERVECWLAGSGLNPLEVLVAGSALEALIDELIISSRRLLGESMTVKDARMERWLESHRRVTL